MIKIPENILEYFFTEIKLKGKYEISFNGNSALIKPRLEEEYYKPTINVKDLEELKVSLENFALGVKEFYMGKDKLKDYNDLSYFFNNLFFNMTASDALDLAKFIDKRTYFFTNNQFEEYENPKLVFTNGTENYYARRVLEDPGLESPYIIEFFVEKEGSVYELPLIRYAFDENNVCHVFAVQFGRLRNYDVSSEGFKKIVNKINSGVSKYRNVPPSFVLSFKMFSEMLMDLGVKSIVAPDFLFGRYKHYYHAQSATRSDAILSRILEGSIHLFQRMEYQFPFFEIESFPNDFDSYTHIKLNNDKKKSL